jgi:hypothetical protein
MLIKHKNIYFFELKHIKAIKLVKNLSEKSNINQICLVLNSVTLSKLLNNFCLALSYQVTLRKIKNSISQLIFNFESPFLCQLKVLVDKIHIILVLILHGA